MRTLNESVVLSKQLESFATTVDMTLRYIPQSVKLAYSTCLSYDTNKDEKQIRVFSSLLSRKVFLFAMSECNYISCKVHSSKFSEVEN